MTVGSGHTLQARGWWLLLIVLSCLGQTTNGAVFFISNGTSILKFDSRSKAVGVVYTKPLAKIIGLAVDTTDNVLFWSDISADHRGLYTSDLEGQGARLLTADIQEVNGLTLDWASNHIYWTDAKRRTLEIANYDGSGRKILVSLTSNEEPRGIVVDPVLGYLYWADQWNGRIERARLNGKGREVVVNQGVYWSNQLALSMVFRKLYWVEATTTSGIMSCNLDGSGVKKERDLFNITSGNPSFGLVVIGNKAIVSTWHNNAIFSTLVGTPVSRWNTEVSHLGTGKLYSLTSLDRSTQPAYNHPCGHRDRGGCSHLCLPSGWGTAYDCSCPSFSGLALDLDKASCSEPDALLLYTFQALGDIGFINPAISDIPQTNILGQSHSPNSVTYDPLQQIVYWSNREGPSAIYRSDLRGQNKEEFLKEKDGLGYVDGLALDWIGQFLYFTNSGQSQTFAGSIFPWHRVEMISLDGRIRRTVVTDVQQPRKIAVDHHKGFLYVVDGGDEPRLLRTNLDGSQPTTLIDGKVLTNPLAVSIFGNHVYLADGTATKDSSALISYNSVNGSVTTLMKTSSNILDITSSSTSVYISTYDEEQNQGHMYVLELATLKKSELNFQGRIATGLSYSKRVQVVGPREDPCEGSPCSHKCIRVTTQSPPYNCICPDGTGVMMTNDGSTCRRPRNFMLVADLNLIQMVSLDPNTEPRPHTVHHGHSQSDILSVVYDSINNTVYWIDTAKIFSMRLGNVNGPTQLVDSGHFSLGGLALDEKKQRLYWSSYDQALNGRIMRMKLKHGPISTKAIVTVNRAVPRTILLYPRRRWIFWTEYPERHISGDQDSHEGSIHRAHTSGTHHHIIIKRGLMWPSALAIYDNRLYAAAMGGRVLSMDLDGANIEELYVFEPFTVGVYEMSFLSNYLLMTNLKRRSVDLLDIETGWNTTISSQFSRPTSLSYYHPTDLTENGECRTEKNHCSNNCVSIPRSLYCTCPERHTLAPDGQTCVEVAEPWEAVEEVNCRGRCGENSQCARLLPTITFHCLCRPGHQPDFKKCTACPINYYKSWMANTTCSTCELRTTTHRQTGSTGCTCRNHQPPPQNEPCDDSLEEAVVTVKVPPPPPVTSQPKPTYKVWPKGNHGKGDSEEEQMLGDPRFTNKWTPINKNGAHSRGSPYFENCPSRETLTVQVAATKSKAYIPVTWSAYSSRGIQIPYITNYPEIDGKLVLEWTANGEDGKHTILMDANDITGQITVCKFYVLVEDEVPPTFAYCPRDLSVKSTKQQERVLWQKPAAEDNIGVGSVTGTHRSGEEFPQGITIVNFTATDQAGNRAYCNFTVHVYEDKKSCEFPEMDNGLFVCTMNPKTHVESCSVVCEKTYAVNPLELFRQSYSCDDHEVLQSLKDVLKYQQGCLSVEAPSVVTQEFTVWFKGPCESDDPDLEDELYLAVIQYLKVHTHCSSRLCHFSNITIECDYDTTLDRNRRSYMESLLFMVRWNVTIDNGTGLPEGQIRSILQDIRLELERLLPGLQLHLDTHQYMAVRKVETSDLIWSCRLGEIWNQDGCVACPPGSRYVSDSSPYCDICPPGTYQPFDRQEECFPCHDDLNSNPGTTDSKQCFEATALDQMSKFIIITACTFGFVFLGMAIILYFQYKRQQKKSRGLGGLTAADAQKYVPPNLFTPPAPLPGLSPEPSQRTITISKPKLTPDTKSKLKQSHLYSNHDYDDMPYTSTLSSLHNGSARTVYQNDFSNMSPPGSPRMLGSPMTDRGINSPMAERVMGSPILGSPVTDRAIYNGDFRNFSPTPRTNSLRRPRNQYHMYED
ncbi:low-density lipoprotein receptor-related protein 5-like [Argopecten irradians]|uniref:low-density lipoprotein receptor-related protein 5-like n=1 Tax=Argopecten irradians TaxID=31199 RepID=UPI00371DCFAC